MNQKKKKLFKDVFVKFYQRQLLQYLMKLLLMRPAMEHLTEFDLQILSAQLEKSSMTNLCLALFMQRHTLYGHAAVSKKKNK